jgi:hypothetical protein
MHPIPEFPHLTDLDLSHQEQISEILSAKEIHSSDFAFYNLMGWYLDRPPKIARVGEHLIIKLEGPDETCVLMPPLGYGSLQEALQTVLHFLPLMGCPAVLTYVPKQLVDEIVPLMPPHHTEPQRADFDYLYSRKELSELAGRKFHQKKNFVNRVLEEDNPVVEMLAPATVPEALAYLNSWYRDFPTPDLNMKLERLAAERLLPRLSDIGGIGILVRIAGRVAGLSVASPIHRRCWVITLEKADKSFKGLYQFVNWALANRLPPHVELINRETDLGIEGLRTAKLSYHPLGFAEKYRLIFADSASPPVGVPALSEPSPR